MLTLSPQHETLLDVTSDARRLLDLLRDDTARAALSGGHAPWSDRQVALVLHELADFPLCMRILPLAGYRRLGAEVAGVSAYLAGFAGHLARHDEHTTYDPRYWILGEPVTDRLLRLVTTAADSAGVPAPTARQAAAVLLALADPATQDLPRRVVEVAGDGDLPWNGATGIGLWLRQLAGTITP